MENNKNTYPKFLANIIIRGKIKCVTGLHIGGSKENPEIGGVDSPVLRNPQNKMPYIPGSSLKGKLRTLLEYNMGVVSENGDVSADERIVRLFGISTNEKRKNDGPTRLIIRDCNPNEETIKMWKKMDSELLYTEYKPENTIDRLTSAANPRFIERVVTGSEFDFEMVYGVYIMTKEEEADTEFKKVNEDLQNLLEAMRLLEHSTLGKSGSRGYGKIKFNIAEPVIVKCDEYKSGQGNYLKANDKIKEFKNLSEINLNFKTTTK
ncbi:MAG: type III-A CRISPR-associated RAMP protein Csm3 [Bacteroidetes bacterium CG23_combo_of_CG06-09_8_20_14_all_32_9]|nr:MAG: type III-A CRISPR-associated RAMP protein Csm3 [Bacteroidetes bacterium CG23_combo_of_CG06-09_8_20_14_all_32_9]